MRLESQLCLHSKTYAKVCKNNIDKYFNIIDIFLKIKLIFKIDCIKNSFNFTKDQKVLT